MWAGVEPQQVQSGTSLYSTPRAAEHLAGGVVEFLGGMAQRAPGVVGEAHSATSLPARAVTGGRGCVRRRAGLRADAAALAAARQRPSRAPWPRPSRAPWPSPWSSCRCGDTSSAPLALRGRSGILRLVMHGDHQAHVAQSHLGVHGPGVEHGHVVELRKPPETGDRAEEGLVEDLHVLGHVTLLGGGDGLEVFEDAGDVDVARAAGRAGEALHAQLDRLRIEHLVDQTHLQHAHDLVGSVVEGERCRDNRQSSCHTDSTRGRPPGLSRPTSPDRTLLGLRRIGSNRPSSLRKRLLN